MLKIHHINVPWRKTSQKIDPPAWKEPLEKHRNVEILYILSGERSFYYDDGFYKAEKGDVFLILPNTYHSASPDEQTFYRQIWLWPGPRALWGDMIVRDESRRRHTSVNRRTLDSGTYCPWVANLLQKGNESTLPEEKIMGLCLLLLSDFLNAEHDVSCCGSEENLPDKQRADIADICRYMEKCSGVGLTVEKLSGMANYSPKHFARLFRMHTGMTVHSRINQLKLKKMREMEQEKYSVKEIAQTLGFANSSAFCVWRKNILRQG